MHVWHRLRRLPPRDRVLIAEAAGLIIAARLGMRLFPIQRVRALLARNRQGRHGRAGACAAETNRRVGWAVRAVASRLPGRTSCLIEALAAEAMLRRRGYECLLRLGVPPADDAKRFAAHAWIENEGHVVVGDVDNLHDYAIFSPPAKS